jgi:hypothetical protein
MQITPAPLALPPGGGSDIPKVPASPEARAMARAWMSDARDAVQLAIIATTATDRIHPELPFWSHSAVENIGRAAGLLQAVVAAQVLTHVPIPGVVYTTTLDAARQLIVDAASAVQAGRPADPAAFASANAKLKGLLGQFDFDIRKHDPIPLTS